MADNAKPMSQPTTVSSRSILSVANAAASQLAELKTRGGEMTHGELLKLWRGRNRPFWGLNPEIYEELANRLLRMGDLFYAVDCAQEGIARCGERPLLIYQMALGLARLGARARAERVLAEYSEVLAGLPDFRPLVARLHKDAWKATHDEGALRKSRDEYAAAALESRADAYYPAVNAATLSVFLDDDEGAARFGEMVRDDLAGREKMNYWEHASRAEAELAAGKIEEARAAYRAAVGCAPSADQLATTRDQASLLLEKLGYATDELADALGRTNIVCFTGHMIDRPGRTNARFPDGKAERVKERMREILDALKPTAAVCAPAAGADLLAAEVICEMALEPLIVLPLRQESFKAQSVTPSGGNWSSRFDAMMKKPERLLETPIREPDADGHVWSFGNELILGAARQLALAARGSWEVVAVWNGESGDGPGGTHHFVSRAESLGAKVWVIDPMDEAPAREWKRNDNTAPEQPDWKWVVHVHAATRDALIKCLSAPEVAPGAMRALAKVELGGQARFVFDDYGKCAGFLASMIQGSSYECGIGVSVGHAYDPSSHDPEFFEDAAVLAAASLPMQSVLATWECAAIACLLTDKTVAFEFVGRTEFPGQRQLPFYTVATNESREHSVYSYRGNGSGGISMD